MQGLRNRLEQEKGKLLHIKQERERAELILLNLEQERIKIEQGQLIIQEVAQRTQKQLAWYVEDMVTAAIDSVFPEDVYSLLLNFEQRRGKTEADLLLKGKSGNLIKPSDAEGGGLINVVAFALRVALWSIRKQFRAVFLLDEPFHFLHSREAHAKIAELLQEVSGELKLQLIMITGEDESTEIIEGADKVFLVKKRNEVSRVEEVK